MGSKRAPKGRNAPLKQTTNEENRIVPVDNPCGVGGNMRTLVKPQVVGWSIHVNV